MSDTAFTPTEAKLGLTPRFEVTVDGHDLGGWQQCSGLEVDFTPESVQEMGENTTSHVLRGRAKYQQIVLSRAMGPNGWNSHTINWLQEIQNGQTPQMATIKLLNAWNEEVASWQLLRVVPIKWQGPSLNASSSQVAIEKLTLAHEGFDGLSEIHNVSKATLTDDTGKSVSLQFNPQSFSKKQINSPKGSRSYSTQSGQSQAGLGAETDGSPESSSGWANYIMALGMCQYSLSDVIFDAEYKDGNESLSIDLLEIYLNRLFHWMEPQPDTGSQPDLLFSWGLYLKDVPCTLSESSLTYERLRYDGRPTRVKMNLTLTERATTQSGTNPTSGGPGGHRSHLLVADESLAAVAYREYGDAGVWPLLAKFNRFDDPFRLRPGALVRIPPMRLLQKV